MLQIRFSRQENRKIKKAVFASHRSKQRQHVRTCTQNEALVEHPSILLSGLLRTQNAVLMNRICILKMAADAKIWLARPQILRGKNRKYVKLASLHLAERSDLFQKNKEQKICFLR